MDKTFTFKLIDILPYKNNNGCRVVCYCNFGFVVTMFCNEQKFKLLMKVQENNNFNINDYIRVFYDNNKQSFAYIINIK